MLRTGDLYEGVETNPYWVVDDGHGWLVVPAASVLASGAGITRFSYLSPNGRLAYLEEDIDARSFLVASGVERTTAAGWPVRRVRRAHCRGYAPFVAKAVGDPAPADQLD